MDVIVNDNLPLLPDVNAVSSQGDFLYQLLSTLGYTKDAFPQADLWRRYHGLSGNWYIISPIHWEASHNAAIITACPKELQLSEAASKSWFAAVKEFVAAENMALFYCNAHTWLIQCNKQPKIRAKPLFDVMGQSLLYHIKSLDETLYWQRFITECQMFLSAHPLNQKQSGPPINGVWVWGGGLLSEPGHRTIICQTPEQLRLASFLTTHALSLQSTHAIPRDSILLFSSLKSDEFSSLQQRLKKNTIHWQGQNVSYTTRARQWWWRLWSK